MRFVLDYDRKSKDRIQLCEPSSVFIFLYYVCTQTKKVRELRNNQGTFSCDLFGFIINYLCYVWLDS